MVGSQLQVDSAHTQENNFGNISVGLTRLFILFVSKTRNLQKVCGHYYKTVNLNIFYSYKYLVSYAQDWGCTSGHSFCPISTTFYVQITAVISQVAIYYTDRHREATRHIFAAFYLKLFRNNCPRPL
jgi:hypothetical protein